MNQILDYNPNKGEKKSSGSDKIVHFFAIVIILFALVLIINGVVGMYQRNKDSKKNIGAQEKAKIEVTQEETEAIIKVTHTKAIEKIIYSWNTGKETTIKASGNTTAEEKIPLPAGDNTLHIKVTDIDGQETTYEGEFSSDTGVDILNPVIKLEVTQEKKLKITATDETKLDFITYRWNDEDEVQVKATADDDKKIEVEIEILKGTNDLVIQAVDSSNNTATETKSFTGLIKPEVKIVVSEDKTKADIYVKHDNGIKEIKVNLNNQDYNVAIVDTPKEIQFTIDFVEGDNKLTVTAKSIEDTETIATEEVSNNAIAPNPDSQTGNNTEPEISIEKSEDGQNAHFKVYHSSGIKELKLNVNDMDYDISGIGDNQTTVEFDLPLVDGNNRITFTAIPIEGNEKKEIKEIVK